MPLLSRSHKKVLARFGRFLTTTLFLSFYLLVTQQCIASDDYEVADNAMAGVTDDALADTGTDEAASLLQGYLSKYEHLSASFIQTTFDGDNRLVQKMEGRLWVSSPDRFRIETIAPDNQVLVSDGKQFWNYDQDLEQVIVSKLDVSSIPVLLLAKSEKDIAASYAINSFEDEESVVFVLSPFDEDSMFASLNLEFADSQLVTLLVRDKMGQATHVKFDGLKALSDPNTKLFGFKTPEGVDVIYED